MKTFCLAVLLMVISARAQVMTPQVGSTVPASISNIAPIDGTPTALLLTKLPIAPNLFIQGMLTGFSYNLNVNGTTYACLTGNTYSDGSLSLSCIVSSTVTAAAPVTPAPAATPTMVNQGAWNAVTPQNEVITENLGWTVGTANSFFVIVAGGSGGNTATSVNAVVGNSMYPMKLAYAFKGRQVVQIYYLPNAPASISSIQLLTYESDTTSFNISALEYSGLSATVAPVGTSLGADSGYVSASTFSAGPYTVPTGAFVLSATASNMTGSWTSGTGWTLINQIPGLIVQTQTAAGTAVTATGSYASGYQYFDSTVVAFQ